MERECVLGDSSELKSWLHHLLAYKWRPGLSPLWTSVSSCVKWEEQFLSDRTPQDQEIQTVGSSTLISTLLPKIFLFGNLSVRVGKLHKEYEIALPGCIAYVVYREWMRCSLPDLWKVKLWSPSRESSSSCTDVVTFPSMLAEGRCFPIWREPVGNVSLMHSTILRQNFPRDWAEPMNQYHWKLIKTIFLIKYKGTRSSQYSGSN